MTYIAHSSEFLTLTNKSGRTDQGEILYVLKTIHTAVLMATEAGVDINKWVE